MKKTFQYLISNIKNIKKTLVLIFILIYFKDEEKIEIRITKE